MDSVVVTVEFVLVTVIIGRCCPGTAQKHLLVPKLSKRRLTGSALSKRRLAEYNLAKS